MQHRMGRTTVVLSVLAIVVTACGGAQPSASTAGATATPVASTGSGQTPVPEPTIDTTTATLTWWVTADGLSKTLAEAAADKWKVNHPNVTVNVEEFPFFDLHDKLRVALEAGSGAPDVANIEVSRFGSFVKGNIGLVDLTERLQPYLSDLVQARVDQYTYQGKIYGVDLGVSPVELYYRQDLFDQAGIQTPIATWSDLIAAGKQLKEKTGKLMFAFETADYDAWTPLMLQFGGRFFDDQGNVILDSPENLKAFRLMIDMVRKDGIAAPAPGGDQYNPSYWAAYAAGDFAAQYGADWMAAVMRASIPDTAGKWRAQPLPTSPDAPVATSVVGGTSYAITVQSQNPDLAWSLLTSTMTREAVLDSWKTGFGPLPSLKSTWDAPELVKEDPFFGGQKIGELFLAQAALLDKPNAPFLPQAPDNPTAYDIFTRTALGPAMAGDRTAEEALKDAANELRATIGQ